MVERLIYLAQIRDGQETVIREKLNTLCLPEDVLTASVFLHKNMLFFYYECMEEIYAVDDLFSILNAHLVPVPFREKKRHYVRMYDIFHYNRPTEGNAWRNVEQGKPYARLNQLRPEMLSSYIFYHNQLQEERPGLGDKYGIIALHENLMFFYEEDPLYVEKAHYAGRLTTKNTPDDWPGLMTTHFLPWPDYAGEWRDDVELIFFKKC